MPAWRVGRRSPATTNRRPRFGAGILLVGLSVTAAPCAAEVGLALALMTDDSFRGQSISDGRPTLTADLSYDDVSGLYAGFATAVGFMADDAPRFLRGAVFGGYSHKIATGVALDGGVIVRHYTDAATFTYLPTFGEAYIGLIGRRISARLFHAPHYGGGPATYGELNALLLEKGPWSLSAHAGILSSPPDETRGRHVDTDWRLSAVRQLGRFRLSASFVGASEGNAGSNPTIICGIATSF